MIDYQLWCTVRIYVLVCACLSHRLRSMITNKKLQILRFSFPLSCILRQITAGLTELVNTYLFRVKGYDKQLYVIPFVSD